MSFLTLRNMILDQNLCTACGGCVSLCPQNVLEIAAGEAAPTIAADLVGDDQKIAQRCGDCSLCVDICPGWTTDSAASERRMFGQERTESERWTGIKRQTLLASAADPAIVEAASAGGAVTALLAAGLRTGLIEAALVVGRDSDRPWLTVPRLVSSESELLQCAQASYVLTPTLQLLKDAPSRVGVVALPCQVLALQRMRNLASPPQQVQKVPLIIELACSSSTLVAGTQHLIENRLNLSLDQVRRLWYRAGEYPGDFTVEDREGKLHTVPFHEMVLTFRKFKTFRCQACPDWWSGLADISVADGDPNVFATSRNKASAVPASLVVTRTDSGEKLVGSAVEHGMITCAPTVFQPETSLGLQRKRHRYLNYRQRYPGKVPDGPCSDERGVLPLSDEQVVEQMSQRTG